MELTGISDEITKLWCDHERSSSFATFDQIELKQDFTDKLDLLDRAVFGVKKLGTQTALYDAIWQFCDEKLRGVSGRRVLVVITDGEDTYSRADLRDAIDIAQRTETTVYVISTKEIVRDSQG